MNVVIDTNQLLRMASTPKDSPLFLAWRSKQFTLITSEPLLVEFETVTARPRVQRFLHSTLAHRFLMLLRERAVLVVPVSNPPSCRDPKDTVVIATALAGKADFIVTSDRDLLDDGTLRQTLEEKFSLQIVYPAEFLKLLASQS